MLKYYSTRSLNNVLNLKLIFWFNGSHIGFSSSAYVGQHSPSAIELAIPKTWYVPLEFQFYHVSKLRYMDFRINGGHLGFPTSVYVGQYWNLFHWVAEPRQCGSSRWNIVAIISTGWDTRYYHIYFRLMTAIFDLRHTQTSDSIPTSLSVLPNPKNMGITVGISLLLCIES